jgi:hypothetical protein
MLKKVMGRKVRHQGYHTLKSDVVLSFHCLCLRFKSREGNT